MLAEADKTAIAERMLYKIGKENPGYLSFSLLSDQLFNLLSHDFFHSIITAIPLLSIREILLSLILFRGFPDTTTNPRCFLLGFYCEQTG
jgi:hypothetical protein